MSHLTIAIFLILFSVQSIAGDTYPALFQAGNFRISSLEQYMTRINEKYSELEIEKKYVDSVEYRGNTYPGMEILASGILGANKVDQKLVYINSHPGLWQMVYVYGEECVKGQAFREGEYVEAWGCKTIDFPIAGAFADLFIAFTADIDIELLSQSWGKDVVPIVEEESEEEKVLSLGDMKKIMLDQGATWEIEDATWAGTSYNPKPEQKAINIKVSGQYDSRNRYTQSFLYIIQGDELIMKEIDGKICRFEALIDKDVCEGLYSPTRVTPFPLLLLNTMELNGGTIAEEKPAKPESFALNCGNISANQTQSLRYHFEKGYFSAQDIETYRTALTKVPTVLDPQGLLLTEAIANKYSSATSEPYLLDDFILSFKEEMPKGTKGNCEAFLPMVEELRQSVLESSQSIVSVLQLAKADNYDEETLLKRMPSLNDSQKNVLQKLLNSKDPVLAKDFPQAALDVAASNFKRYLSETLDKLSDPEELMTAAFVKHDAYSRLLLENEVMQTSQTLYGHNSKKYFGITVATGSSHHYVRGLHPDTLANFNIQVGDRLLKINKRNASDLSAKAIDDILVDVEKDISLKVVRGESVISVTLKSREIDIMEYFYALNILKSESGENILKVSVSSFEAGLSQSLSKKIKDILNETPVAGIILDLQNNPGGNADEAVGLVSLFVKDAVASYYRIGARSLTTADPLETMDDVFVSDSIPLVVQVNSNSASSSEIAALALKDFNRGVLIGSKTFGKLVSQSYFPVTLGNNRSLAMLITTTEHFGPLGKSLNGRGIEPHINVYSPSEYSFSDGNALGKDYVVPTEASTVSPLALSEGRLEEIQSSIKLDQTDIDKTSIEVLLAQ